MGVSHDIHFIHLTPILHVQYVSNIAILSNKKIVKLEMQSCHNDVRAMTPCFYVSNERASLGLSRAICTKSVASVILEIGGRKKGLNSDLDGMVLCLRSLKEIGIGERT